MKRSHRSIAMAPIREVHKMRNDKTFRRLFIFFSYVALCFAAFSQARATELYTLSVTAQTNDGESYFVGGVDADTYDACVYNMGLMAGTWYNQFKPIKVKQQYTRVGNTGTLSFFIKTKEKYSEIFLFTMVCKQQSTST